MKKYDAVDRLFKKPFKFKYGGIKLTARPMDENEVIQKKTLWRPNVFDAGCMTQGWQPSGCVGEPVSEYPEREYILVLSPYYKGESVPLSTTDYEE